MYLLVYAEINVLCIVMLLFILFRVRKGIDQQASSIAFQRLTRSLIVMLFLDTLWTLVEGRPSRIMRSCNAVLNALYLTHTACVSLCWLSFTERKIGAPRPGPAAKLLLALPICALAVLSAVSVKTGWLFTISPENAYRRGPLHALQPLLAYSYLALSMCGVIRGIKRARTVSEKEQLMPLLSYFLPAAVGGVVSAAFCGIPGIWPCSAISLLMVYVNAQEHSISTDSLTGLNNRRQFDRRLRAMASEQRQPNDFFLLLMDIDSFKQINDTFGHSEGDRALCETAGLLKKAAGGLEIFLARFGGDEFAALGSFRELTACEFRKAIKNVFRQRNLTAATPYKLSLSVGVAEFGRGGAVTIPALILAADRQLYEEKSRSAQAERGAAQNGERQ